MGTAFLSVVPVSDHPVRCPQAQCRHSNHLLFSEKIKPNLFKY
uniref:Uncharacterized protein n=1 Tax=Anguilla anguilla TaxID=7936 RepID=A0A0E9PK10_ANGAN